MGIAGKDDLTVKFLYLFKNGENDRLGMMATERTVYKVHLRIHSDQEFYRALLLSLY